MERGLTINKSDQSLFGVKEKKDSGGAETGRDISITVAATQGSLCGQ